MVTQAKTREWVMLSYRVPREPSTPRIAIWRELKQLGVVQIGDGLVALPNNDRTSERLEWVGSRVREADGEAIVWIATPTTRKNSDQLIAQMNHARNEEYGRMLAEINEASGADRRTISRWRRELRKVDRRDYFDAKSGEAVRVAIAEIVDSMDRVAQ